MGLLNWLFGRTPRMSDTPPDVGLAIILPDGDTPEHPHLDGDLRSDAVDPVFCIIDYTDAEGNRSRRRVTTRAVRRWGNNSLIIAHCHERNALRHFRADRIERIVTHDGEVFGPFDFLRDILGLNLWDYSRSGQRQPGPIRQKTVNFSRYTSPAILTLTAAARVDAHLHPEEVEQIHRFAEREAMALLRAGLIDAVPSPDKLDIIGRRIGRLRPTQEDIAEALDELRARPADQIERLKHWLARVIAADGRVHIAEEGFMADFDRFLKLDDAGAQRELDGLMVR